ncbi:MAG: hypothetical protein FJX72_16045 [Armatimonadetes bacterium]|nr:hypothetical protein [Armatimonadota bacterium]
MPSHAIDEELREELDRLPLDERRQVLDFARALASRPPRGTPGWALRRFAGGIPKADLELISAEIQAACEQVNRDEW